MRRKLLAAGLALTALAATQIAAAAAGAAPSKLSPNPLAQRLARDVRALDPGAFAHGQPAGRSTRQLGALHLAGGLNADVWAHGSFAYVGTWSGPCPGTGVKVIDVSNPARPRQVATLGSYPNTSDEDMQVITVDNAFFHGDLLATGLQDCGLPGRAPGKTGVDLWDVTDAARPSHLGFFDTGAFGTHEVSLTRQGARVFALAAVPFSEVTSGGTVGDFQLIEVTDPRRPVRADDWGAGKDGHLAFGLAGAGLPPPFDCTPPPGQRPLCRGHFGAVFDHSASPSADGRRAYLAYWDAGGIILDISNPNDVRMIGRTVYPANSEGDTHTAMPNALGTVLITDDEDFSPTDLKAAGEPKEPGDTWGFARIWNITDPARPREVADFATPHSLTNKTDAFYSVHNVEIVGSTAYFSWYSDGLRVVDISDPARPHEIAFFRPKPTPDPTGFFCPNFGSGCHPIPFDWGLHVLGGKIYLSDINFGLRIVTLTR
jgi:hypothetical protein